MIWKAESTRTSLRRRRSERRGFGFGGTPEFDSPPLANNDAERQALAALEPRIHQLVDGYLDAFEARGEMDVVADFSFKLPIEVVCDMLGVPSADRLLIRDWALLILGALEPVISTGQFDAGCAAYERAWPIRTNNEVGIEAATAFKLDSKSAEAAYNLAVLLATLDQPSTLRSMQPTPRADRTSKAATSRSCRPPSPTGGSRRSSSARGRCRPKRFAPLSQPATTQASTA